MLKFKFFIFAIVVGQNMAQGKSFSVNQIEKRINKHPYVKGEVLVKFKDSNSIKSFSSLFKNLNLINVSKTLFKGKTKRSVASEIAELLKSDLVEYAEPNYIITINMTPSPTPSDPSIGTVGTERPGNDPLLNKLYGMNKISAQDAWKQTLGTKDILVGVVDTGIDYNHEDLAHNIYRNPGESGKDSNGRNKMSNGKDDDGNGYVDDVVGYDFYNNDSLPYDDNMHGTHCSGTIAGRYNNSSGVVGVAPNVSIIACKFLSGQGSGSLDGAIKCIDYLVKVGVDVMSNSWGGGGYSQALEDAIKRAEAKNILFIAAAGNGGYDGEGDDNDTEPTYPANYNVANVISVAATDENDNLTGFSNFGKNTVHLGAPGENILSTVPKNKYQELSGTSMATPHVAGAAALLWSKVGNKSHYSEIKRILLESGDSLSALNGKTISGKRLNINKALNY